MLKSHLLPINQDSKKYFVPSLTLLHSAIHDTKVGCVFYESDAYIKYQCYQLPLVSFLVFIFCINVFAETLKNNTCILLKIESIQQGYGENEMRAK